MLEAEGLQIKGKVFVGDGPLLGQLVELPFTAAFVAAVVVAVGFLPAEVILVGVPYYLGIGTDKKIISPSLKLLPGGSVYYLIIFPIICNPHIYSPMLFLL